MVQGDCHEFPWTIIYTIMGHTHIFIGRDIDSNLIAKYNEHTNELTFHIHLNRIPFHKRIKKGILYIFGSEKNGHYKAFTLMPANRTRMLNLIRMLK